MMLTLTAKHKLFLSVQPIDFRTRLDGTLAICRQQLNQDPSCGHVFIFRNKKLTVIRCIVYDSGGFWFVEKRLSKGSYRYWPKTAYDACELSMAQLQQLLDNQSASWASID